MWSGLVESSVSIPSGSLNYIAFGRGSKNLIIIHGLSVRDVKGSGASLALLYRSFAKEYRVYCFDRRTKVQAGLTIWDLAEDIFCAMQALGLASADVFGVSQGGMIAMALALEHPERVHKLALGVTAARTNETLNSAVAQWVDMARRKDHIAINQSTFTLMYTARYLQRYKLLMPLLVRLVKPRDFDKFAILASSITSFNCYDRLQELRCPVLVLGADQDRITTGQASREIADKLHGELYMYADYGHAAYEEAKDFNRRIYDFLMK